MAAESTRARGNAGENLAADYYEKHGYRVLCRNFKGAHGEIDIIAEKDAYIVFAEVKLRSFLSQKPAEAVDPEKMLHIVNTANEFLCEYKDNTYIALLKARFDVFEILAVDGRPKSYRLLENVPASGI